VGLIASDLPQNVLPEESAGRLFREYANQAAALARGGAQVIVMPEKLGVIVDPATRIDADGPFQAVADQSNVDIVVGLIHVVPPVKFNEARVYSPGSPPLMYEKHHMLPAFESKFRPGTTQSLMRRPSGLWGIAICKDMDFPGLSREYGEKGIGLLLVPAWDFDDDGWLHDRMAVVRGVESGFSIVRAAKQGLLTISDDRGRVLAERRSSAASFATLLADVPVILDSTPYLVLGDWVGWISLALLMLTFVRLYVPA
jgi:apolipoprotein N-acyltransferase